MKLKMTSDNTTVLKHGEPFVLVDSETVACVRLPIEGGFDPELIEARAGGRIARISYAEDDDDDKDMLTITREDGGDLQLMHGYHSTYLGHAEFWVFDPAACINPSQL